MEWVTIYDITVHQFVFSEILCLSAVVVVISNVGTAFLKIGCMVYEDAYNEGHFEIVEGTPHSQLMSNGGFFFSAEINIKFFSEIECIKNKI